MRTEKQKRAKYILAKSKYLRCITLRGGKCEDCGFDLVKHFYAAEFHHLDNKEKELGMSDTCRKGMKRVLNELDKCVLLCSNCHKRRHSVGSKMIENIDEIMAKAAALDVVAYKNK